MLLMKMPPSEAARSAILFDDMDNELTRAWTVMYEFCAVINFAAESGQRISTETFLETMSSVVYRLLGMKFDTDPSNEAVRLGLLAFLSGIFLQWKGLGMSYPHFTSMFRGCLNGLASPQNIMSPHFLVWLLMIGVVSVFDTADDVWLHPFLRLNIRLCGIYEWSEMQKLLGSFMWIGLVYDKPGKVVFESTIA